MYLIYGHEEIKQYPLEIQSKSQIAGVCVSRVEKGDTFNEPTWIMSYYYMHSMWMDTAEAKEIHNHISCHYTALLIAPSRLSK